MSADLPTGSAEVALREAPLDVFELPGNLEDGLELAEILSGNRSYASHGWTCTRAWRRRASGETLILPRTEQSSGIMGCRRTTHLAPATGPVPIMGGRSTAASRAVRLHISTFPLPVLFLGDRNGGFGMSPQRLSDRCDEKERSTAPSARKRRSHLREENLSRRKTEWRTRQSYIGSVRISG